MARPRINDAAPLTTAEKLDRSRQALLARGGRRITLNLSPEAATALDSLMADGGESATAVINWVLVVAAGE